MRGAAIRLTEASRAGGVAVLAGTLESTSLPVALRYPWAHGALLRLDGAVAGAFEPAAPLVRVAGAAEPRAVALEVELDPGHPGRTPPLRLEVAVETAPPPPSSPVHGDVELAGAWSFAQGRRRALRVLAAFLERAEAGAAGPFVQGQAALYAGVENADKAFFERVVAAAHAGKVDPSVAAFWAECDCNIPSGESLLRQIALGSAYVRARFGTFPSAAWFAGAYGFPNTFPQLLHHAGVRFLATGAQLPHPQFVWRGPDATGIVCTAIDPATGGARDFEALGLHADRIPRVDGSLDTGAPRGVLSARRDVKARRFALEAALDECEELCAWCMAVRAPSSMIGPLVEDLRNAWPPFLRGDARRVAGGTAIPEAYAELDEDYARVERIVERVRAAAYSVLPRGELLQRDERDVPPREEDDVFVFENPYLIARVRRDGTLVELSRRDGPNHVTGANVVRAYADKPKANDDAQLNRRYDKYPRRVRHAGFELEDDALLVRFRIGRGRIVMRIALGAGDRFLRVDVAVLWDERKTLLRLEHWLAIETVTATLGSPHGTVMRAEQGSAEADPADFEAAGQRYARVDGPAGGVAVLAKDVYGWSVRGLKRGGISLGLTLLRGTDSGEHGFGFALAPLAPGAGIGEVEQMWRTFAYPARVRLFTCDDPAILIVACKPADDGDGIIVRVRECDGAARRMRLQCGGRARQVESNDGRERPLEREAALEDFAIVAVLEPYELRTFRVRF